MYILGLLPAEKRIEESDSNPKLIQTNSTNAWGDFPRDRNGQVYYGGMNTLGTELLQQGGIRHSGIIAADFPGPGLIDSIIKLNGVHSNEKEILISQIPSESSLYPATKIDPVKTLKLIVYL